MNDIKIIVCAILFGGGFIPAIAQNSTTATEGSDTLKRNIGSLSATGTSNAAKPKLVLQLVVSQMRYDYIERFSSNFGEGGFKLLLNEGANFVNANYNYMQTNTVAGLATLATGCSPEQHGVIGENWIDFTSGRVVNLIDDSSVRGLDSDDGVGYYSPRNLVAGTIADRLRQSDPRSKSVSIASSPYSAIVSGGSLSDVYWVDEGRGAWMSSTYYFDKLPLWVQQYNKLQYASSFVDQKWVLSRSSESYFNKKHTVVDVGGEKKGTMKERYRSIVKGFLDIFGGESAKQDLATLRYNPIGNFLVTHFAREAIINEDLGKDSHTDFLTICYDTPRLVSEIFGPESMEVEDMYYRLDGDITDLLSFVFAQYSRDEVVVILTSDHGASDTFIADSRVPMGQFNTHQFKIIMNGFLSAQYEPGEWVVDYFDRQLYLNREMMYTYGFNLADVQTKAAAFALQFRGVSGALTATALQSGSFGSGYGEKMQNSYYPKRSGDVVINMQQGWIEEIADKVSLSGSLYEYDTHVPLAIMGFGIQPSRIERKVNITDVAPTLARIMKVSTPNSSTGEVINEIIE